VSPKTSARNRLPPLSEDEKRAALAKALREFNAWRFYDCHETLEDVWRAEPGPDAGFYQGIIKVAAGFHHLLRGNHSGTLRLTAPALALLEPFRPSHRGVNVARLVDEASACLERVRELGPRRLAEFDRSSIPRIDSEGADSDAAA
jgi:predicted metal-dependent hydrolase